MPRNTRKASRKADRRAPRKASRKADRKATRKTTQKGGKRSEWLKKVMRVYKDMKARNPNVKLGDAMKAAKSM
jgi:hypothetical protein